MNDAAPTITDEIEKIEQMIKEALSSSFQAMHRILDRESLLDELDSLRETAKPFIANRKGIFDETDDIPEWLM